MRELAKRFKLSEVVASRFINQFFEAFPGVRSWANRVKRGVHEDGFVTTITNRQRQVLLL